MSDLSWGKFPRKPQQLTPYETERTTQPIGLARGNGRSYGDVCLAGKAMPALDFRAYNKVIRFDEKSGLIRAQAGVLLSDIIELVLPKGWFLPVTPGTKHVTLGGAIANDVHGKNHHKRGCFGRYIRSISLHRSDTGTREINSEDPLFAATVAGLGLTGHILDAELQLSPVGSANIRCQYRAFANLDEYFELSDLYDPQTDYSVSWVDCLNHKAHNMGRGIYMYGGFADDGQFHYQSPSRLSFPIAPPCSLVSNLSTRAFNELYYQVNARKRQAFEQSVDQFFYPLDAIRSWNRIYGPKGFVQFQFVLPLKAGAGAFKKIFQRIAQSGQASFLAVLKRFGDIRSPGLLSFPREGHTLALDFPMRGHTTIELIKSLEALVMDHGGAIYPAKDALMSPATFRASFPQMDTFLAYRDPEISSSFIERVCP